MNRSRPGGNSKPNSVRASFLSPVQERFETDEVCVASSCSALFQTIWKDEVRSSGKNAVFELKCGDSAIQVQPTPRRITDSSLFIDGEMQAAVSLAEGEELGSNFSRIWYQGVCRSKAAGTHFQQCGGICDIRVAAEQVNRRDSGSSMSRQSLRLLDVIEAQPRKPRSLSGLLQPSDPEVLRPVATAGVASDAADPKT